MNSGGSRPSDKGGGGGVGGEGRGGHPDPKIREGLGLKKNIFCLLVACMAGVRKGRGKELRARGRREAFSFIRFFNCFFIPLSC